MALTRKEIGERWRKRNLDKCRIKAMKWREDHPGYYRLMGTKIKMECLSHYSNYIVPMCNHPSCIETDLDVLSIDHIDNSGNVFRKETNSHSGRSFYRLLKRLGYPVGYQVLCFNHNFKKHMDYRYNAR